MAYSDSSLLAPQKLTTLVMPAIVTLLVTWGFFAVTGYLIKFAIPPENKDILLILVGVIAAKFGDTVAFWINSSMGSHNKDKTITNISQGTGTGSA